MSKAERAERRLKTDAKQTIPYDKTPADIAVAAWWKQLTQERGPRPSLTMEGETLAVDYGDHASGWLHLMAALGVDSVETMKSLTADLTRGCVDDAGGVDLGTLNQRLALVTSIGPKNTLEAMLAVQMALVHSSTVKQLARLPNASSVEQYANYGGLANKLARTFTGQIDALKRLRSAGEQKVIVEHRHYHLAPGSQAVFGDVTAGGPGGVDEKTEGQSHERHERLRLSQRSPMLGTVEALGLPMQGASDGGQEGVQVSRRKGRGALRVA